MTLVGDVLSVAFFLNNGFNSKYLMQLGKIPNDRGLLQM
jgi:hypothetical protein